MQVLNIRYCDKVQRCYCDWEKPDDWWKKDTEEESGGRCDISLPEHAPKDTPTLEQRFNQLATQWKADIGPESTVARIVTSQPYLQIIRLGEDVIPYILKDLQKQPNHWFIALRTLANNFSPVKPEDAGNIKKMTKAWLKWGKENGKID